MNGRRSNIEIIADILRMGQASKTQIMYRVGMSFAQLQKYLDYLLERGFLIRNSFKTPGAIYSVSQEGKSLLQSIERIEQLLAFDNGIEQSENISQSLMASQNNVRKGYSTRVRDGYQPHEPSNSVSA